MRKIIFSLMLFVAMPFSVFAIAGTGSDPISAGYPIPGLTVKPGGFPINTPTDVLFNPGKRGGGR